MYLSLNGVTVRIAVDSVSMSYVGVGGETERSPSGDLVGGPTSTKREWRMTTTPVPASEVDAWAGLIEGKGHAFPLDTDRYSLRGRGPSVTGAATITASGMKWGAGCLVADTGVSGPTWSLGLGASWSVMWWSKEAAGVWEHWAIRSDGAEWHNGVSVISGTSHGEVTVSGGAAVVFGADGTDWLIDDVVAFPFAIPASWASSLYAQHSAGAWSALPRVTAAGTFAPSSVTVRGKVTDVKVTRQSNGGALTAMHAIEFTLREV